MVFVRHLISQTVQPMHLSVMKWGMRVSSLPYACDHRTIVDEQRIKRACAADEQQLRRATLSDPEERARRQSASRGRGGTPAGVLRLLRRNRPHARSKLCERLQIEISAGDDPLLLRRLMGQIERRGAIVVERPPQ